MINIKSKKGITLVSLVITVIVLLILSGVTISSINLSNGTGSYNNMVADIKLLNDKILVYYNKYGEIPKTNRIINIDETEYHEIDLSKLEDLTLNYGDDYGEKGVLKSTADAYVINSNLHIYYLKGIKKSGEVFHSATDLSEADIQEIEYTELEYIENTGTQYINTGFVPNSNTAIEMKLSSLSTTTLALYCARGTNYDKTYTAFLINGQNLRVDYNNAQNANLITVTNNTQYTYKQDKNFIYVNNELIKTLETSEFSSEYDMFLLSSRLGNSTGNHIGKAKMYYCKILDNGTLVRDFIPCKDKNGIVCLYDKVEGKYYYNQGTGEFIAGPEV